jgi:hypothetical protein
MDVRRRRIDGRPPTAPSRIKRLLVVAGAALALAPSTAMAWSNQGHMVTGAIAYDDLMRTSPKLVAEVVQIEKSHPDRARFEVRLAGLTGAARERMLFELMARWPDDARKGPYDHPSWHYYLRPINDPQNPVKAPPFLLALRPGQAPEAFALARATVMDAYAPAEDRAVAMCWVFHLAGDIQQPLHAGHLVSKAFPFSDRAGESDFVRIAAGAKPMNLHEYWDNRVGGDEDDDAAVDRNSRTIEATYPRAGLPNLDPTKTDEAAFHSWADESYALAAKAVYRRGAFSGSPVESQAVVVPADYDAETRPVAEKRVALGGYRIADTLRAVFK